MTDEHPRRLAEREDGDVARFRPPGGSPQPYAARTCHPTRRDCEARSRTPTRGRVRSSTTSPTAAATSTARPCRRTPPTHPAVSAPSSAPAPGAAYSSPTVPGPPPNSSVPSAGNSARGMPKTMAFRSIRKVPCSARRPATERSATESRRYRESG